MKQLSLMFILLIGFTGLTFGQSKESRINELFNATGFDKSIAQIERIIGQMLEMASQGGGDDEENPTIQAAEIFKDEFGRDTLRELFTRDFIRDYNEKNVAQIISRFNTELFKSAVEAEIGANESLGEGDDVDSGLFKSLPKQRAKLIDDYIKDTRAFESLNDLIDGSMKIMIEITNMTMPKGQKLDKKTIDDTMKEVKQSINSPEARENIKSHIAQTYQGFDDKQLGDYFAFYRSPEGKWFLGHLFQGYKNVIDQAFKKAMDRINKDIKR